jgi:tetratricopeptide (TPR) repeat protein
MNLVLFAAIRATCGTTWGSSVFKTSISSLHYTMSVLQRFSLQCVRSYRTALNSSVTRRGTQIKLQPRILPTYTQFSTHTAPRRSIQIPPLPIALCAFGFGCLGFGLYQYFTSDIQKYPVPVRQALRKALYYENYGNDPSLALDYYKQALELALESEELEDHSQHVSGIMIQYGTLLENQGKPREARDILTNCIGLILHINKEHAADLIKNVELSNMELEGSDRIKSLGIAQKLGDLSVQLKDDASAEKWYSWSVEQMFKSTIPKMNESDIELDAKEKLFNAENMPKWLTKTDVGAAMEALAAFYAERRNYEFALPLYLRALSLYPSINEQCHASVLMCNISEVFAGMGQYQEAVKWAEDGIELAKNPNTGKKPGDDRRICDESLGVLFHNMGMIYEVSWST